MRTRRVVGIAVLVAALCGSPLLGHASIYSEQTVTNALALAVTSASTFTVAYLTVEGGTIHWRDDGTAPTTSVGHKVYSGGALRIEGADNVRRFRMIAVAGDVTVKQTLY